jgi:hypothetical protein
VFSSLIPDDSDSETLTGRVVVGVTLAESLVEGVTVGDSLAVTDPEADSLDVPLPDAELDSDTLSVTLALSDTVGDVDSVADGVAERDITSNKHDGNGSDVAKGRKPERTRFRWWLDTGPRSLTSDRLENQTVSTRQTSR